MKCSERKGLRRNRKTGEQVPVGASSQKSDQLPDCRGGVCPFSSPPAPSHMAQNLHHFDSPCALQLCPPQCAAVICPSCCYLTAEEGGGKTFKGSCHSMSCWMARPPGGFAWREERTSTSPWPSPGWVSDEDVSIMRTHNYTSFFLMTPQSKNFTFVTDAMIWWDKVSKMCLNFLVVQCRGVGVCGSRRVHSRTGLSGPSTVCGLHLCHSKCKRLRYK